MSVAAEPAGATWHVRLIVVLVVLMGAVALDRAAVGLWVPPNGRSATVWTDALFFAQQGASVLCAGLLVDMFGLRRVGALALIAWYGLIMLGGVARDASSLGFVQLPIHLIFGVIYVAPFVAVKHGTKPGESALTLTIPLLASYLEVALVPSFQGFVAASRPFGAELSNRMWLALVCACAASFITMIWLALYRDGDGPDAMSGRSAFDEVPRLLADRRVWALAVVCALDAVSLEVGEHSLIRFLAAERGGEAGSVVPAIYYTYLAAIVGALVAAVWSDRMFRHGGSLTTARRPFAIAGFALSAALALVPLVRRADIVAMSSVAAAGIGVQFIVSVIVLDVAPRRSVGTLLGVLAIFDSLTRFAIYELELSLDVPPQGHGPILFVGGIVGVVGAIAVVWLWRRIEPIRDRTEDRDLPAVFN